METKTTTPAAGAEGTALSSPLAGTAPLATVPLGTASVAASSMGDYTPSGVFAEAGLIVPPVSPEQVRSLFKMRQAYYTALLDPAHDFLYSVSYMENGKPREYMTTKLASAESFLVTYKGSEYKARPRKSGVEKLAESLGIQGEIVESRGLPNEKNEDYALVRYKATHVKTGRVAYGVGWCDVRERPTMSRHALIATADSRSFSRAVLRLIGYGEVGAEEILAGISEDIDVHVDLSPPAATYGKPTQAPIEQKAAAQAQGAQKPKSDKTVSAAIDAAIGKVTTETLKTDPSVIDPDEKPVHIEWSERKDMKFAEDGFNMDVIRSLDPAAPKLTNAQCADFSKQIVEAFEGDKAISRRFLRQHGGVNSTTDLKVDQTDRLLSRLAYITTGTPF